jgi:hypothetical protein
MVDEATHMTPFGGWEKAVNMVHMRTVLLCGLVHNLHKWFEISAARSILACKWRSRLLR